MGDASQTLPPLRVRPDDVKGFLASLEGQGRCRSTLLTYASKLDAFLCYLPDGRVSPGTLAAWRDELIARGHSSATANSYLSAANGLVGFLERRDLQLSGMPAPEHERRPTLPRREYLRVLSSPAPQAGDATTCSSSRWPSSGCPPRPCRSST